MGATDKYDKRYSAALRELRLGHQEDFQEFYTLHKETGTYRALAYRRALMDLTKSYQEEFRLILKGIKT